MRSTEEIAAEIVREIRKENVPVDEARIHNMVDVLTTPSIAISNAVTESRIKSTPRISSSGLRWGKTPGRTTRGF